MSKASEWADHDRAVRWNARQARRAGPEQPVFYGESVSLDAQSGGVWADRLVAKVLASGLAEPAVLCIAAGHHLSSTEAVRLARWILDMFGDAPDGGA